MKQGLCDSSVVGVPVLLPVLHPAVSISCGCCHVLGKERSAWPLAEICQDWFPAACLCSNRRDFQKSMQIVVALSERWNTKPVQAGAKRNTTFVLIGSLQNELWVSGEHLFPIKRTGGLQSHLLLTGLRRVFCTFLAPVFWTFVPPLTFKWLPGYCSSLRHWQGPVFSPSQWEGVWWSPFSWDLLPGPWLLQLWVQHPGNSRESQGKEMLSFWCPLKN